MSNTEVTVPIAQHVLWHFGDTNLGLQPGTFVERLLMTMSAADQENFEVLRAAFPGYGEAFDAVAHHHWGLDWLRNMVKAKVPA